MAYIVMAYIVMASNPAALPLESVSKRMCMLPPDDCTTNGGHKVVLAQSCLSPSNEPSSGAVGSAPSYTRTQSYLGHNYIRP